MKKLKQSEIELLKKIEAKNQERAWLFNQKLSKEDYIQAKNITSSIIRQNKIKCSSCIKKIYDLQLHKLLDQAIVLEDAMKHRARNFYLWSSVGIYLLIAVTLISLNKL